MGRTSRRSTERVSIINASSTTMMPFTFGLSRHGLLMASLMLLSIVAGDAPAGEDKRADLQPFSQLKIDGATAFRTDKVIILQLDKLPPKGKLKIPRLANVIESIHWVGQPDADSMTLKPEIDHWIITLENAPAAAERLRLRLVVKNSPQAFDPPLIAKADEDGTIRLPARFAKTHGSKLRFEPQPHKNTIGYWTMQDDFAEWHLQTSAAGRYEVRILQGCGKGHGGSKAQVRIGDRKIAFTVQDTGHFQNFRWRELGEVQLPAAEKMAVRLTAIHKAAGAVMDCREIRLVPVQ